MIGIIDPVLSRCALVARLVDIGFHCNGIGLLQCGYGGRGQGRGKQSTNGGDEVCVCVWCQEVVLIVRRRKIKIQKTPFI